MLERFEGGLETKVSGNADTLSLGQRQLIAFIRAVLRKPELLILDEPTVGLDPVLRVQLWKLFYQLAAQGKTLLVSSHVMDEADSCDSLVLIRNGKVLAQGSPTELRERTKQERMDDVFIALVGGE